MTFVDPAPTAHWRIDAVREAMPQFPLDRTFECAIPGELAAPYRAWRRPWWGCVNAW
ncbi:MAG: hypothetical protein WAU68_05120 [Vitreimonas sp.]